MKTASYTDLKNNLKKHLDSVINDSETIIVNRGGGTGVVIMSLDEYNSIKETEHILSSPQTVANIRKSEGWWRESVDPIPEGTGFVIRNQVLLL
jgi:antitoxin YefM